MQLLKLQIDQHLNIYYMSTFPNTHTHRQTDQKQ